MREFQITRDADCFHPPSEKFKPLGIMGTQLGILLNTSVKNPLKPLDTKIMLCSRGARPSPRNHFILAP